MFSIVLREVDITTHSLESILRINIERTHTIYDTMLRFAEREAEAAEAAVGEERREAINAQEDKENLRT